MKTFAEKVRAFEDRYGSCPIETGVVGNLADTECEHGFLPSDGKRTCDCWPLVNGRSKRKAKR